MEGPQVSVLPDGRRLHMNHGPIDLIVEAWGELGEVEAAYRQAAARFRTVLTELVAELADLRQPVRVTVAKVGGMDATGCAVGFTGSTARRMASAAAPFAETFITPMAAVAGAVADEMLAATTAGRRLDKAYVNDGGDIAIHLSPGALLRLAIGGTGNGYSDRIEIGALSPVRGIATSGWRGRSFSLGIADAVTVLADNAATADAAATMIANAVDLPGHPEITRAPASSLQPDTDLCDRLVTTAVGALSKDEIALALARGRAVAHGFAARGLIHGAALFLAGELVIAGAVDLPAMQPHFQTRSELRPTAL